MALPGHEIESFLPSEIARLVYGYLEEEGCPIAAQAFLDKSVHLKECLTVARKGKKFNTKILGLTLEDLLDLLSEAICFAKAHRKELIESISCRKDSKLRHLLQIEIPSEENNSFKPDNCEANQLSSFGLCHSLEAGVQKESQKSQCTSKFIEKQSSHWQIKEEYDFEDVTEEDEDRLAHMEVYEPPHLPTPPPHQPTPPLHLPTPPPHQPAPPPHQPTPPPHQPTPPPHQPTPPPHQPTPPPHPTTLLQVLPSSYLGSAIPTVFMQQPSLYPSSIFPDSTVDSAVSAAPPQMPIGWTKLKAIAPKIQTGVRKIAREKKEKIVYKMQDRNSVEENISTMVYRSRPSSKLRHIAPKVNQV